jgi:hypothetical protein
VTHLIDVVRINSVTSFINSLQDPTLHLLLDMLLAFLVVNIQIPLIPLSKLVLQGIGTGTHAIFVDWHSRTAIAFRIEKKLVATV